MPASAADPARDPLEDAPSRGMAPLSLLNKCRPLISGPCRQLTSPPTGAEFHGSWAVFALEHNPGRHVLELRCRTRAINAPRLCGYDLRPFPIFLAGFAHADAPLRPFWRPIVWNASA
jgi:hypothetical protein